MKPKLTARQQEVLDYIVSRMEEDKKMPNFEEIGRHFEFSSTAARDHVDILVAKKYLSESTVYKRKAPAHKPIDDVSVFTSALLHKRSHTPEFADANWDVFLIPVYRRISDKDPHLIDKYIQGFIPLKMSEIDFIKDECFAFPYNSESMSGSGILEGDYVIARLVEVGRDNDIVLVNVRGKNTLRRIFYNGNQIVLFSDNPGIDPQVYSITDIKIICQYIGIHRLVLA